MQAHVFNIYRYLLMHALDSVCAYTYMCTHVHIHRLQSQLWIGLYMYVYSCLHACQKFEMTKHLEAEIR